MTIRADQKQWLIYQEEQVTGVVKAVETILIALGAATLMDHSDIAIRAIGNFGERLSETRIAHMAGQLQGLDSSDSEKQLVTHLLAISAFLAGGDRPEMALEDVHAALVWVDKRANEAGVVGPGWYREIIRESTLGR